MPHDVIDLILTDHRELERLYDLLMEKPEQRTSLIPLMTALLTAHGRAEESEVYPAARAAGSEKDVQHSQREHLEADQLAANLAATDPHSPDFVEKLRSLVKAVRNHIDEEEGTLLPDIRERIDEGRRMELGDAFLRARERHLGEQPGDQTKAEFDQQAANLGLAGASSLTKDSLEAELRSEADL